LSRPVKTRMDCCSRTRPAVTVGTKPYPSPHAPSWNIVTGITAEEAGTGTSTSREGSLASYKYKQCAALVSENLQHAHVRGCRHSQLAFHPHIVVAFTVAALEASAQQVIDCAKNVSEPYALAARKQLLLLNLARTIYADDGRRRRRGRKQHTLQRSGLAQREILNALIAEIDRQLHTRLPRAEVWLIQMSSRGGGSVA